MNNKGLREKIRGLDENLLKSTASSLRHDKIEKDNIKNIRKNMEKENEKIKKSGSKPSEAPVQEGRGVPVSRPRRNSIG